VAAADVLDSPDVAAIRKAERLTQEAFAKRYGFTHSSVRGWEQRRRTPALAARVLLTILAREPAAVRRALNPKAELNL
jgi:putative transcriptional regulator